MRLSERVALSDPKKIKGVDRFKSWLTAIECTMVIFLFAAFFLRNNLSTWFFLESLVPVFAIPALILILALIIDRITEREIEWYKVPDNLKTMLNDFDRIINGNRLKGSELKVLWEEARFSGPLTILAETKSGNHAVIEFGVCEHGSLYIKEVELIMDKELAERWLMGRIPNNPNEFVGVFGELKVA